jgi:23S rRNA (cytidine1920-2'-O)/16S rRNA (cytidine1409-2'-O)-methyltransferase
MKKVRIDSLLVAKELIESREKARALILAGKVLVNGTKADKAGTFVRPEACLEILQKIPYVSRGGLKLEAALKSFNIDVKGKIAMDVGASTGGFTDCLLQHGARKIYAIDVGYGQLAWKLRNDSRVILLEKTNIRYLDEKVRSESTRTEGQEIEDLIKSNIDIATVDVSFISLLKVIPKVINFLKKNGEVVALIKPQFEVTRKDVGKGGVVRDEAKRLEVIEKITKEVRDMGLEVRGVEKSVITGPKGNVEYFIYLKRFIEN